MEPSSPSELTSGRDARLPHSLIVKILSYNIESVVDLAKLRSIGPEFVVLAPLLDLDNHPTHFIRTNYQNSDFFDKLLDAHTADIFEIKSETPGDTWITESEEGLDNINYISTDKNELPPTVFDGATIQKKFLLREGDRTYWSIRRKKQHCELPIRETLDDAFIALFSKMNQVHTIQQLEQVVEEIKDIGLCILDLAPFADNKRVLSLTSEEEEFGADLVRIELFVRKNAKCIHSRVAHNILMLKNNQSSKNKSNDNENRDEGFFLDSIYDGAKFPALITQETDDIYIVEVLLILHSHVDYISEFPWADGIEIHSILYDELFRNYQEQQTNPIEGVSIVDGFLEPNFRDTLNNQVGILAQEQEARGLKDYHPHSNNIVRDIVHPALYSYIKDYSLLVHDVCDVRPCYFPPLSIAAEEGEDDQDNNCTVAEDFWGRTYEDSVYQWLPTYFSVGKDNSVVIQDYINNLVPRGDQHIEDLYNSLAKLFQQALPYMESVYSYVRGVRPLMRHDDWDPDDEQYELPLEPVSFRGKQLQVICKIVDYELQSTPPEGESGAQRQSYEGVWHVEGMSHEEIVLTCLYILDRDTSIQGGEINFQRTFLSDEAALLYESVNQTRHPVFESYLENGLAPLGQVKTPQGRLIVFPNSHVHKVGKMFCETLDDDSNTAASEATARRRIVVFFLVNPLRRIPSTREVPPQQEHAGGNMSLEEAKKHRLNLMKERKLTKQDWNVRDIELCEH